MISTRLGRCVAAAMVLFLAGIARAGAAEIFLQSELTGGFVRSAGAGMAIANGNADNAIRFEMIRLEGGRVAFRASNGTFLRAGVGRDAGLAIGSPHIRGWETFEIVQIGRGVGLRSVQNGKLVEVERRSGLMYATGSARATQAQFTMPEAPRRRSAAPGHNASAPRVDWTGRWTQVWIMGANRRLQAPPAGSRLDFTISVGREVSASAGCNTVASRFDTRRLAISFSPPMTTKRLCDNPQGRFEEAVSRAFDRARSYEYREGQVVLLDGDGRTVLQIAR